MKKRLIRIGGGAILALLILGGVAFWYISRSGSGALEGWIGGQIQTIANGYINPKLSFTDLDYTYPLSVSLKDMKLTADDPSTPGKTIDVISCESAAISLGEIPSVGKPIVIEKISLVKPQISAIATASGSGEFVGFSNLLRDQSKEPEKKPEEPAKKLSEVFRMRLVELVDGKVVYDPRIAGTVPMMLDQINTSMAIEPTAGGKYKLSTAITRKPVFEVTVAGMLDLDDFKIYDADIKLLADLGAEKLDYLPPELQKALRQYDAKGKLSVQITGTMPAMEPMKGNIHAGIKLESAHLSMSDFKVPVENLDLAASFADGKVNLEGIKIVALGGTANLSGSAVLNDRLDADLTLAVNGMVLENLLKQGPQPNAAKLDLNFKVAGSLKAIMGQIAAPKDTPLGVVTLRDFRLSADDPWNAGQKVDIVAVKDLDIAISEPVISGKPIVIDKIILNRPILSAVAVAPNSVRFVGMPQLPPSLAPAETATPSPEPGPRNPEPAKKLSDLIRVKTFQLKDAKVVYDPRIPNTERMWLDNINTSLNVDPANPGVYVLNTAIGRKPVFDLAVAAKINLDNPGVENLDLKLLADLTQGQMDFLVPQVQALLKQTDAKGKLMFAVSGSVPLDDLTKAKLHATSTLDGIQIKQGDSKVPVESFNLLADVVGGKVLIHKFAIAAMGSTFDVSGTAALTDRMETDLVLKMEGVPIEKVLAGLDPSRPATDAVTLIDADVRIKAAVSDLLNPSAGRPGVGGGGPARPIVELSVSNFHLTADDGPDNPVQFVWFDSLAVTLSALPSPGKPVVVEKVVLKRPGVKAVAIAPGSSEFVGFANLQKLGGAKPTTQPASVELKPAGPAAPAAKLSELFRVGLVQVDKAVLIYDPKIKDTAAMKIEDVDVNVTPNSATGESYAFAMVVPDQPDMSVSLNGRANVDTMLVNIDKLAMNANLAKLDADFWPPQVRPMLKQYQTAGQFTLNVAGTVLGNDPTASDLMINVLLDKGKVVASNYVVGLDEVKFPVIFKDRKLTFPKSAQPNAKVWDGAITLDGGIELNDRLDVPALKLMVSQLSLDRMRESQVKPDPNFAELTGKVDVNVVLKDAPLLVIAAHTTPPATRPSDRQPGPMAAVRLPDNWGNGEITVAEARLAGFELIQKFNKYVKSAYNDVLKRIQNEPTAIRPKESAKILIAFQGDKLNFTSIDYEGEVVKVKGTGSIALTQYGDFSVKGSPLAKLGSVMEKYTNSLITYRIFGPLAKMDFKVESDGKEIKEDLGVLADKTIDATKKGANTAVEATGKAADVTGKAVGKAWDSIFGKKKEGEK